MENKKKVIRKELYFFLWFIIGFATCYIVFVTAPLSMSKKGDISSVSEKASAPSDDQFMTLVQYNENGFKPNTVTIQRGNYIIIRNQAKDRQMWLSSDNPLLTTRRGYAQSEQIQTTLIEPGSYTVKNNLDLTHTLLVVVR
jgi:hypothetical protein